jgi:hypothetical protein
VNPFGRIVTDVHHAEVAELAEWFVFLTKILRGVGALCVMYVRDRRFE